ncbi:hypothetical protein, partial [Candidatus Fokinia crypta]|uniref:hypothetical protein n=1 Tax=Candidatus Fokinia crypta TaxID=1920990 RepID=UPI002B25D787
MKNTLSGIAISIVIYGGISFFYRKELDGISDDMEANDISDNKDNKEEDSVASGEAKKEEEMKKEWWQSAEEETKKELERLTDEQKIRMKQLKATEKDFEERYVRVQEYIKTYQVVKNYRAELKFFGKRMDEKTYKIVILESKIEQKKLIGDGIAVAEIEKEKLKTVYERLEVEGEKLVRILQDSREYIETHPEVKTEKERMTLLAHKMNESFTEADILHNKADKKEIE